MSSAVEAGRSLRSFLDLLKKLPGDGLAQVGREVSPVHEVAAVVKRMEGTDDRPVLFENVAGSDLPVLMNLYGSKRRIALALGLDPDLHPNKVVEDFSTRLSRSVAPRVVRTGPVQENVSIGEDADLGELPIGVHAPLQAGPYINSGVMLVRDPDSRSQNAGIYRLMVHGARRLSVSVDPFHDLGKVITWGRKADEPVPFAIVIGFDPALAIASQAKVPISHDAYEVMGALVAEPVEVVQCETNDLYVPASAEIVIEGHIPPGVTTAEGPYGEFSYYYGSDDYAAVCEVDAIMRRKDAIYADIHPVHGEHRCLWLHPGREESLLRRLQATVPTVRSVQLPLDGGGMVALVALEDPQPGDARRALVQALCADVFIKHAVAVDVDIDIDDPSRVVWALTTRFQADRDVIIVPRLRGYSEDPSGYGASAGDGGRGLTTKIGYDATASGQEAEPADLIPEPFADLDPADYVDVG